MTERDNTMRVLLYGCVHKPKVSAMVSPKKGEKYFCGVCKRERVVTGVETTWARARVQCMNCDWKLTNNGSRNRKQLVALAVRHANVRLHRVSLVHDAVVDIVKPQDNTQIPLIDDLLLP